MCNNEIMDPIYFLRNIYDCGYAFRYCMPLVEAERVFISL